MAAPRSGERLKALAAKSQQDGLILNESQVAALEKAKAEKETQGEFESGCPGYCGAQDFLLAHLKRTCGNKSLSLLFAL